MRVPWPVMAASGKALDAISLLVAVALEITEMEQELQ